MTDMHNFSHDKQRAIEQLLDMNKRALQTESFSHQNTTSTVHNSLKSSSNNLGLPLTNDALLIIGLILILSEDCRDMWLFLALLYILM